MGGDVLQRIMDRKAERLGAAKRERPLADLERAVASGRRRAPERFADRLARPDRVNVVAEVKRASPSKGVIRADLDPVEVAAGYAPWAAAISVLTEEDHFGGSLEALRRIRERVDVPLLRKDFIFDPYQLAEAVEAGADATLLIVAALEPSLFAELLAAARELKIDILAEVHTAQELETVLHCGHTLVGINNRNLKTFEVDVTTSYRIAREAPEDVLLVSESGIVSRSLVDDLRRAGFDAFLIGEYLMRAPNPGDALRAIVE